MRNDDENCHTVLLTASEKTDTHQMFKLIWDQFRLNSALVTWSSASNEEPNSDIMTPIYW